MNYDIQVINRLSDTSEAQRASNIRWYAMQGEQTQIEAMKLQGDLIRKYRREHRDQGMSPEFTFAMHALALSKMIWLETAQTRKGVALSDDEFQKIQEIRVQRIKGKKRKKASPKMDIIRIRFYHEIGALREKGLSWRQICDYLKTHHKIHFTHSYLKTCHDKLSTEREKVGLVLDDKIPNAN